MEAEIKSTHSRKPGGIAKNGQGHVNTRASKSVFLQIQLCSTFNFTCKYFVHSLSIRTYMAFKFRFNGIAKATTKITAVKFVTALRLHVVLMWMLNWQKRESRWVWKWDCRVNKPVVIHAFKAGCPLGFDDVLSCCLELGLWLMRILKMGGGSWAASGSCWLPFPGCSSISASSSSLSKWRHG